MKVMITGARGMVGRNLLEAAGAKRHVLLAPGRDELDLLDASALNAYLRRERPDLVIHAAGRVGGIAANMAAPYEFMRENLQMGVQPIEAAIAAEVPRFLNFSSSCVYPREAANPLRETSILTGPLEPTNEGYALAKLAVMKLGQFADSQGRLSFKTLLPCNLYGRYDRFDPVKSHLLPSIVLKVHRALEQHSPTVEVWGTGRARREFMLASDLARITWTCIDQFDNLPAVMNVGVGTDHSIDDFYQTVAKVLGWQGKLSHDTTRPEGMAQKLVDTSHMRTLGLAADTSLEAGIKETYEYFLSSLQA